MAVRRRPRSAFNADINVTSLVDVAFVLLIIFMITAPMMQGGVQVRLPRAEARPLTPEKGIVVSVDRTGRIYVDQAAFSYQDFRITFRALVARRKPSAIYLRADRAVPYGDVVRVLAVIRASGVRDIGLVAEQDTLAPCGGCGTGCMPRPCARRGSRAPCCSTRGWSRRSSWPEASGRGRCCRRCIA